MTLADALEARATEIVERSFNVMYSDPFWRARFGERGEKYTREDHVHHVCYLLEAIRSGDSAVLASYAKWLQPVLTSRGMCTKHIDDSLLSVRAAIAAEGIDANAVDVHIEAARTALRYTDLAARAVEDAAPRLAEVAHRTIAPGRARDVFYLLSFMGDAIALDNDDVFVWHARWLARCIPPGIDVGMLDALAAGSMELAAETATRYRRILAKARSAVSGASS